MKTRILFLDDEPLALQGLQRMLRNMRAEWDMTFVESGPQALEELSRSPFDIVVSDVLMPGMNGAQFLNEVRTRHPECVRLVLSGHADRELICQCLKSAHQALAKPCQPDVLKATVTRLSWLRSTLANDSLRQAVARMNCLPSSPALYQRLEETLQQPEASVEDVGAIVIRDVGMTAKLLQLVNSGFFGIRKPMFNAAEAVSYLGLDTIKTLVLTGDALVPFPTTGVEEGLLDFVWQHSLDTALGAKTLALVENLERKASDEAFAAGLLHDAGKFVLVSHFGRQYNEVVQLARAQNLESWAAEEKVLGVSHAAVGAYLVGLWGLPASIVETASLHHTPNKNPTRTFNPLTAVHVANALVPEWSASKNRFPPAAIDVQYLSDLGMADRLSLWREALRGRFSLPAQS